MKVLAQPFPLHFPEHSIFKELNSLAPPKSFGAGLTSSGSRAASHTQNYLSCRRKTFLHLLLLIGFVMVDILRRRNLSAFSFSPAVRLRLMASHKWSVPLSAIPVRSDPVTHKMKVSGSTLASSGSVRWNSSLCCICLEPWNRCSAPSGSEAPLPWPTPVPSPRPGCCALGAP